MSPMGSGPIDQVLCMTSQLFQFMVSRCTDDSECLGHVHDKNRKSCGLIYGSNDQNQVVSTSGDIRLYVKGKISMSRFWKLQL